MPIYEYQCNACGDKHDAIQKSSEDPLKDCPACGKPELNKLVSATAFRLGGTGWYETDFKSGSKKNLAGDAGNSEAGKSDSAKAEGKSESASKPEKFSESKSSDSKKSA